MYDGFIMGLGFTLVLILLGAMRELLGTGVLFANMDLLFGPAAAEWKIVVFANYQPFLLAILPPGAFIFTGLIIVLKNIIDDQIKKRQRKITRALPYNIDLLTLSVEAGLDFQAALGTVVDKGQPGPLIEEFNIMLNEIKLGKTRAEAMRNLADRIQLVEVSAFVSNLIQADRMGTSLGKVLRIQTNQLRIARTHRAETLANQAPVKMLLPLIGCIFPTVFLILFGPIVYRLMQGL